MLLGCIADDFTGATDLANTLVRNGMRTVQVIGLPDADLELAQTDAVVVALKSRTIPAAEAVQQSLAALAWLRAHGARQCFFKYCSTFDSTPHGNIGPVAEALLEALESPLAIVCPAFPEAGRTLFKGHLFVGDRLLSESGMENHPLTPMTDANLVRVMSGQTSAAVGLVPVDVVDRGAAAIAEACADLASSGFRFAVVDALADRHLEAIGEAVSAHALVTGGSGVALGLPANFRRAGLLADGIAAGRLPSIGGRGAVIAGSCSRATLEQIDAMHGRRPGFKIDARAIAAGDDVVAQALAFCDAHLDEGPVLVYSSAAPEEVAAVQKSLGRDRAGAIMETALAEIARALVARGVRRLVVAGGETSGAVVSALGVRALRIGPQIDPGVPWTVTLGKPALSLTLKSGNFGGRDFFTKALEGPP